MTRTWICIQLGAREHYAIPRALALRGELQCLVTDAWVRPGSPLGLLHRHLRERFHPELAGTCVRAWSAGLLAFEFVARARKLSGWRLILARNAWFQARIARHLGDMPTEMGLREMGTGTGRSRLPSGTAEVLPGRQDLPPVLFAYSYAALEPFAIVAGVPARKVGERTHDLKYRLNYEPFLL
jgi:hypothetical protein